MLCHICLFEYVPIAVYHIFFILTVWKLSQYRDFSAAFSRILQSKFPYSVGILEIRTKKSQYLEIFNAVLRTSVNCNVISFIIAFVEVNSLMPGGKNSHIHLSMCDLFVIARH